MNERISSCWFSTQTNTLNPVQRSVHDQRTREDLGGAHYVTCSEPKQKHPQGGYDKQSIRHWSESYDSVVASHYPPMLTLLPLH